MSMNGRNEGKAEAWRKYGVDTVLEERRGEVI